MLGKASLGMPYLTFAQGIGDRVYAFHSHGPWYAINLSQDQLVSGSSLARPKVDLGYAINVCVGQFTGKAKSGPRVCHPCVSVSPLAPPKVELRYAINVVKWVLEF